MVGSPEQSTLVSQVCGFRVQEIKKPLTTVVTTTIVGLSLTETREMKMMLVITVPDIVAGLPC